ncbi:MAG: putative Ig domain-containing protein [Candidatus Omnitrophica bacterium]|nr:putative Ig domain-containing protein [Candidatus Omnitrophota bacterium]
MLFAIAGLFILTCSAFAEVPTYNWLVTEIQVPVDQSYGRSDPSLAIDNQDEPHISFGVNQGSDGWPAHIYYTYRENNSWQNQQLVWKPYACAETSIFLDSNSRVHIAYATEYGQGVSYRTNKSGSWQEDALKGTWTGNYESMCIDDNGNFHVAYWNNNGGAEKIHYMFYNGTSWQPAEGTQQNIDTDIKEYSYMLKPVTVIVTHGLNPVPYVIAGRKNGGLKYYYKSSGTWVGPITFGDSYNILQDPNGAMAFDSNNNLYCIVQLDISPQKLFLGIKNPTQWSYEEIAQLSSGSIVRASLTIDTLNQIHVAYVDGQDIFYKVKEGATWSSRQKVNALPISYGPKDLQIKLNNATAPRIVYSTIYPQKVYYVETERPNTPPEIDPIPLKTVNEGVLLSFPVPSHDDDGDLPTYSLESILDKNYPEGATISSDTGIFQWTPTYDQAGYYEVNVKVTDGRGGEDTADLQITVQDTPAVRVGQGECIQDVIDDPQRQVPIIYVSSGTYAENLMIEEDITLIGDAPYNTILKGNIAIKEADPTIENFTILYKEDPYDNVISFTNAYYSGLKLIKDAGITAINSNVTVKNCIIKPDPEFLDTLPGEDNSLKHYGKGIQIWNMYQSPDINPQIGYNLIQNADTAIYCFSQAFGGAILGQLKNNTLYNNNYGLILRMHEEKPEIKNNIIVNGKEGISLTYRDNERFNERTALIHHNDVWGNAHNYWLDEEGVEFTPPLINKNISLDPLFVNPQENNFYLQEDSPCLNAADDGGYIGAYPIQTSSGPMPPLPDRLHYYTNKTFQVVTGAKEPNTSLWSNGTEVVPLNQEITWSFTASGLIEGDNMLMLTVKNSTLVGSYPPVTVTVTVDTRPPIVITDALFDKMAISDNPVTVSGACSDNSSVTITVNGIEAALSNGKFSVEGIILQEGDNLITITATDEAGNVSEKTYHVAYKSSSPSEDLAYQHIYDEMDKYYKKTTEFKVQAKDFLNNKTSVNINAYLSVTDSWQEVEIPLVDFASGGVNLTQMVAFLLMFDNPVTGGTIYLDDIKLKEPSPQTGELLIDDFQNADPHVNSLGYWTSDSESCALSVDEGGTHKIVWDNSTDYWYTAVYNGTTPTNLSSYDRISFKIKQADWHTLRLIESYVPTPTFNDNYSARIYDTALAICALVSRGKPEDLERAKILSYALKYCQDNDPIFQDGRLRDVYWSTNLIDSETSFAAVKAPDSGCGNMAWAMIAWLQFYRTDPANNQDILNAAIGLANFLNAEYYDTLYPGYFTGYRDWEPNQVLQTYKSVEINSTVYAAFMKLFNATGNPICEDSAVWAKRFVEEIGWNKVDKLFWAGTLDDGLTINTPSLYIDSNAISIMALGKVMPFIKSLKWVEDNYAVTADGFTGFDCNRDLDGVWFKGTAQMGIAYSVTGDTVKSSNLSSELRRVQTEGLHTNGKGLIVASHDSVTSGWGYPYYASPHIGTTAWFALLERNVNPLWGTSIIYPVAYTGGRIAGQVSLEGRTNYTAQYTFILSNTGQTTPIAEYAPINDEDPATPGIQITLDRDGKFNLFDIPEGTYDLSVKTDGYLRQTISGLEINDGSYLDNLVFDPLMAGDCNNDNIVDSKDSVIINNAMGTTPGQLAWDERADVNGDGVINSDDYDLINTNIGKTGSFGKDILGPTFTIDLPAKYSIATYSPINITVSGKIDDNNATVTVNGVQAAVQNGRYTASNIFLTSSSNIITVRAVDGAGQVTEITQSVKFDTTTPMLVLEDFEDTQKRIGEWWDKNGSIVYQRWVQDNFSKDGTKSLKVEYHKFPDYENSCFGAQPIQDGITNNFTRFSEVRFWVYTENAGLSIKLSIEDIHGGTWEKTRSSTVQGTWEEFIYDFSDTAIVDFSQVKNIIFTVNPGDSESQGNFNIDSLRLISSNRYVASEPPTPALNGTSGPDIYDTYSLEWTDTSSSGGNIYELWEDENPQFSAPKIYWLSDISLFFKNRVVEKTYYYKIRSWSLPPDEGGLSSQWSNVFSVAIANKPPEIARVDSFVSNGDNDNQYEKGLLVNINVVEGYNAPDIVGGTVRIISASTGYDSGVIPLSLSEDGTYWTYCWDTTGRLPASDYIVQATLKDTLNQTASNNTALTISLDATTSPLLSKLVENTDLSYPARGMTVKITRIYDHSLRDEEPFGKGWTHSCNIRLKEYPDGRVDFVMGNGTETMFTPVGDGAYTNMPGVHDKLTKNPDNTYKIRKKDGTILNFGTSGQLLSIVDTNSNAINFAYYPDGRLHIITDPSTGTYTFVYKTWTAILESTSRTYTRLDYIEDPAGRKVTYGYHELYGYLISVKDPLQNTTDYAYTTDTQKLNYIKYPEGGHRYFTYYNDEYGRLQCEYKDNNEEKRTYIYSSAEPKLTIRDYYGKDSIIYFNDSGRPVSITDAYGKTTYYTWDDDLNRTSIKDPEGNEIKFTYDDMGNLLTLTRNKAGVDYATIYTYDPIYNKVKTITDAKNRLMIEFDYDPSDGNPLSVTNKIPDGTDYVATFAYDSYGQLETKTDAKTHITRYTYYNNGLLNEEKREKDPATIYITAYIYDNYGNPKTITDAEGHITTYTYSVLNQLLEVKDANQYSTYCTYDKNGNLKTIKDSKNHLTTYNYNLLSRLTNVTYEYNEQINYTYDKMGNLKTKKDQNNNTVTYDYDDSYRLKTKTYQDTTAVNYYYYDDGALKDVIDSNGTIHYDYNEWNELEQVTYPGNVVVSYGYDELGNRTSITYPSGKVVSYDYDIVKRMKTITLEGATPKVTTYTWNELSQREKLELPNGAKVDYTYDTLNRLESLANSTFGGSTIAAFTYTHDKVGNRKTMTDAEGLNSYTYDPTYQLTNVDYPTKPDQHYVYDPAGNRETVTEGAEITSYSVNNANRYYAVGSAAYTYYNTGCLKTKTDAGGTTYYQYDYDNRLTNVIASPPEAGEAIYTYDYLSRRIKVNDNGTITKYIYDGNRVIAETDNVGNIICEYVYGNSIDEILYMIKGANFYYYHYDGLGSVKAITDPAGAIVETYTYDAYGKPTLYDSTHTEIPQSQFGNRHYFTGREFDKTSGLYYYRARYYNCSLGRFMSPDPAGPVDGPNLYAYVNNNPLNWVDSLGLARRGSRPVDGWPGRFANHDQIFYDDGTNSGFFNDDSIRDDVGHTEDEYDFGEDPTTYDDDYTRQAEEDVQEDWDMDWRMPWWNPWDWNHCQHYCDAVIDQYGENLLRDLREKYGDAPFGKK